MTVIAYKNGLIAADSMASSNNHFAGNVGKIARNSAGDLIGASGSTSWCSAVTVWFAKGERGKMPFLSRGNQEGPPATAIIIRQKDPNRLYFVESDTQLPPYQIRIDPQCGFAIGCGREVARGAMFAGGNAITAVKAAIYLEDGCGGDIHAFGFKGGPTYLYQAKGYER